MKYGETLRQRSIPAWSHYNIDYDDIKHFIKERTTPGKGKDISIPGRGDGQLLDFENSLFDILQDQHHRIDLFVKSKVGEIHRRLDHSRKQLRQLTARHSLAPGQRIPVARLERYGRLENDILKAGDEIRSLARFTGTQRTAFRKLLKKYKKWTGSTQLEDRFRSDVLDDPKSFTQLDLGPLLDSYSSTLQSIQSLWGKRRQADVTPALPSAPSVGSSTIPSLYAAVERGSRVEFDTAIATIPLGESGTLASYFVHPDNVVELQVLLLQYMRHHSARSRSDSTATPVSISPSDETGRNLDFDYFLLGADDPQKFAAEQNALAVDDREHNPGATSQRVKFCARWNWDEDVRIAYRLSSGGRSMKYGTVKKKHLRSFVDKNATVDGSKYDDATTEIREDIEKLDGIKQMYRVSSCRTRFVGNNNTDKSMALATLDSGILLQKADSHDGRATFPFAVLLVRQENIAAGDLLAALDNSHLTERIRGFSLEHHAAWQTSTPSSLPPPFWLPTLDRDIRKLPPPALTRKGSSAEGSSGARTATDQSASTLDAPGAVTDSTTTTFLVDSPRNPSVADELERAPLKSFRNKRHRAYPEQQPEESYPVASQQRQLQQGRQQQRYWSEYDYPEDDDPANAYVIYIHDKEPSALDRFFERIGGWFASRPLLQRFEQESLLPRNTPPTPPDEEDGTSSDDDEAVAIADEEGRARNVYGTFSSGHASRLTTAPSRVLRQQSADQTLAAVSLAASLVLLAVGFLLQWTGRRKAARQVRWGVGAVVGCCLLFACGGLVALMRSRGRGRRREGSGRVGLGGWGLLGVLMVLGLDVTGAGLLVAWMVGV